MVKSWYQAERVYPDREKTVSEYSNLVSPLKAYARKYAVHLI